MLPSVNHWTPDASANKVGVLENMTPEKAPMSSPDNPNIMQKRSASSTLESDWYHVAHPKVTTKRAEQRSLQRDLPGNVNNKTYLTHRQPEEQAT